MPAALMILAAAAVMTSTVSYASEALDGSDANTNAKYSTILATEPPISLSSWTVAARGSGTSYALDCEREHSSYSYLAEHGYDETARQETRWTDVTAYTAVNTTLCDGRPRIIGSLTQVSVFRTQLIAMPTRAPGPEPSCSIDPSDCAWLQKSFVSADHAYSASFAAENYPDSPSPVKPQCTLSVSPDKACGQCTIHGVSVDLMYFPVTTPELRDMCATAARNPVICPYGRTYSNDDTLSGHATAPCQYLPRTTTTTTDTGPSTVIKNTTFYSNRAYISFSPLFATNSCGRIGGTYSNSLVTVASSDLYSLSGYHYAFTHAAYPFRFADLNSPVPASAYLANPVCENSFVDLSGVLNLGDTLNGIEQGRLGFCNPIIDAAHKPILAVPPQMRDLDAAWSDCLLGLDGLYDPPVALAPVPTIAFPSMSNMTSYTSVDASEASPTRPRTVFAKPTASQTATTLPTNAQTIAELSRPAPQSPGAEATSMHSGGPCSTTSPVSLPMLGLYISALYLLAY